MNRGLNRFSLYQKIISERYELVKLYHINCGGPVFWDTVYMYFFPREMLALAEACALRVVVFVYCKLPERNVSSMLATCNIKRDNIIMPIYNTQFTVRSEATLS